MIGYLDGGVGRFKSPKGPNPEKQEPQDLIAQHLQLWVRDKSFPVWESSDKEFGWANNPK